MQTQPINPALGSADFTALTRRITSAEVRAFRMRTKAAERTTGRAASVYAAITRVTTIAVVIGVCALFVALFGGIVVAFVSSASNIGAGGVVGAIVFLFALAGTLFLAARSLLHGGNWPMWLRMSEFAQANGLQFTSVSPGPAYPGCIFNIGDSRQVRDHLTTVSGRFIDMGNCEYSTGSGKNRQTHRWGYLAMNLDRNLPNIVLDSRENNGLFGVSNLPASFDRNQRLSLEGDFDKYFTLYCPKEYEQDALYVFTPDLMALLIDDASPFDVEIVDNWLFLYSARPFSMTSAATFQRLFRIVQTVGAKTVSQTANYRDDRVGGLTTNMVAPAGRRLRRRFSLVSVVVLIAFLAFWALSLLHGF
jgi:hypothetical protein